MAKHGFVKQCEAYPTKILEKSPSAPTHEKNPSDAHGFPQNFFQVGGNVDTLFIIFRLLTFQCKWTFTKRFTVSTPQRKCLMKASDRFASILKSLSSGAVSEFVTMLYYLLQ